MIKTIASDPIMEQAFAWLREQRQDYPHHNDMWLGAAVVGREEVVVAGSRGDNSK